MVTVVLTERETGGERGERESRRGCSFVRYPRCWTTGRGDQEKETALSPTTVLNISGAPDGSA